MDIVPIIKLLEIRSLEVVEQYKISSLVLIPFIILVETILVMQLSDKLVTFDSD